MKHQLIMKFVDPISNIDFFHNFVVCMPFRDNCSIFVPISLSSYLVNVSFYLLLRANQTPVKNHPVIERLVQYREVHNDSISFPTKLMTVVIRHISSWQIGNKHAF